LGDVSARIALANARADLTLVFGIHVFAIERDCARQTEIATFTCRNRRGSRAERLRQLIEHAACVGILTAHDGQRRISEAGGAGGDSGDRVRVDQAARA
jgi:hypothetical protein